MRKLSIDEIKALQYRKLRNAGLFTLFASLYVMCYVMYQVTFNPVVDKPALLVVFTWGTLIGLFSIVSLFSIRNK